MKNLAYKTHKTQLGVGGKAKGGDQLSPGGGSHSRYGLLDFSSLPEVWSGDPWGLIYWNNKLVSVFSPQPDEKVVDGGLRPDANGKDPNPSGQTEGSKWQKPRLTRKSLMKCCLVKWIIASTTQQGPGRSAWRDRLTSTNNNTIVRASAR